MGRRAARFVALVSVFGFVVAVLVGSSAATGQARSLGSPRKDVAHPIEPGGVASAPSVRGHVHVPGTPVACGDVIATDTTLIADLTCPSDALVIGATGVTLDLAGHTLSGQGVGIGVSSLSSFVITIENGSIQGFGAGVVLGDTGLRGSVTISQLTVTRNVGIGIDLGGDSWMDVISGNTISRNGGDGIRARFANDASTFNQNNVFLNGGDGFAIDHATSTFTNNDARRNSGNGISVNDSGASFAPTYHFQNNTTDNNGGLGISVIIFDDLHPPQNVDDEGGNEAKLNGNPAECVATMIGQETPFSLGLTCTALPDSSNLSISGRAVFAIAQPATLSATLLDLSDMSNPIAGETVTFQLGRQNCTGTTDANGEASCTIPSVFAKLGPEPLIVGFAGDSNYRPSSDNKQAVVFAFLLRGAFSLGDLTAAAAAPSTTVTWWGDKWLELNALSGGAAPAFYQGFANPSTAPPACGQTWTSAPGNTGRLPRIVPSYMATIVTSRVTMLRGMASGDIAHIVVVKTNPGYSPNPASTGTGTIVATYC